MNKLLLILITITFLCAMSARIQINNIYKHSIVVCPSSLAGATVAGATPVYLLFPEDGYAHCGNNTKFYLLTK